MLSMDLAASVAAERSRDLTRAVETSRLAALARCCRPSTWRRAASRLVKTAAVARRAGLRHEAACCVGA